MRVIHIFALMLVGCVCFAQSHAESAQSLIYFPHFVNGGDENDHWITSITFANPSDYDVSILVRFWNDQGLPLSLEMNGVFDSEFTIDVPAYGLRDLQATHVSGQGVSGFVQARSTYPVQAICAFKRVTEGKIVSIVTAEPTQETYAYTQVANRDLGIAIANSRNSIAEFVLDAIDADGRWVATKTLRLEPFEHRAFNVGIELPNLSSDYRGLIKIYGKQPENRFWAWALYDDGSRVNSSLPSGRAAQPVALNELVERVYTSLLKSAEQWLGGDPIEFKILPNTTELNAYATKNGDAMYITLPLVELLADSPDELAHVLAHEIAHLVQARRGSTLLVDNKEFDADIIGAAIAVDAGYNPYAMAGVLARIAMVTGTAGLLTQITFDNMTIQDAHSSLNRRIDAAFHNLQAICELPQMTEVCVEIKRLHRPHLPPAAPLGRVGSAYQPR